MRIGLSLSCLAIAVVALFQVSLNEHVKQPADDALTTEEYLANLDISAFERQGSDFANPNFSPLRIGKPLEQIDVVYVYDFKRLNRVEKSLANVDRQQALKAIFDQVTEGTQAAHEKHLAILEFLQRSSFHHSMMQPVYPNKQMVTDPLVLLELGEMRCGHVARVAVDLFESAGFRARLVQLARHVIAEILYEGQWHYFDADIFGNGETAFLMDGTIPSVEEMSRTPYRIDALAHYHELSYRARPRKGSDPYPSWSFFAENAYGPEKGEPVFYAKTASKEQQQNTFFGWNYYQVIPDEERQLYPFEPFYQPGAVTFTQIKVGDHPQKEGTVYLEWSEANDRDSDLLGYQIFISRKSRGWAYGQYSGPAHLKPYIAQLGWSPEMYEALFQLPPHNVQLIETTEPFATLPLEEGRPYFITVMPYDAHGESVGKRLYSMSHEIKIEL